MTVRRDELLAPARRYAEALLALAREKGQIADCARDLAALRGVVDGDAALARALVDPKTARAQRRALVEQRLLQGRQALVAGLLRVLLARRREEVLPFVFQAFGEAMEREEGLLNVLVQTATPLEADVQATIEQQLAKATGRPLRVAAEVRPEILGGMRFLIDSTLIDASVRSRLERLQRKMLAARV
jgi:F-type H+-transporting ATPase subunit delta